MLKAPNPDICPRDPHPGTPPPNGPQNLVEGLEVVPFDKIAGEDWCGKDTYVLSLWTEDSRKSPCRVCPSADAVEQVAELLEMARKSYGGIGTYVRLGPRSISKGRKSSCWKPC